MASTINPYATRLPDCNGRAECDPAPACPACGGLECLCRPRFFAGQLLTEEDLNRLDRYIVAKNRLHNRHLHGWGVACGLEVTCNGCGDAAGSVRVKPGYALSPCGNDIVVCRPEIVDACALINRCRPATDDCVDVTGMGNANDDDAAACRDGNEDWVLAVCYSEQPSRGITPQLRAAQNAGGCGCGGKGGGGCGCGGKGDCGCKGGAKGAAKSGDCGCARSAAPNPNVAAALPEQCEPTLVCEGYRFVAYKAPKKPKDAKAFGAAQKRFLCCVLPLFRDIGPPSANGQMTPQQAQEWVYDLREAVREYILGEGFYDCRIAARLAAVEIPDVGDGQDQNAYTKLTVAAYGIMQVAILVLQKCLCAALLPPCPEPSEVDCVPLATLTVSRSDCRVLKVCNLSARRFLVTIPTIEYWLSLLGATNPLRTLLERLCCRPIPVRQGDAVTSLDLFHDKLPQPGTPPPPAPAPGAAPAAAPAAVRVEAAPDRGLFSAREGNAFFKLLMEALDDEKRTVNAENLVFGAFDVRDGRGAAFASPFEMDHPTEFLLSRQVIAPLLRELVPDMLAGDGDDTRGAAPAEDRTEVLARELAELKATVEKQQKTIAGLKKRRG